MSHDSDCSTNNAGVPELIGPCDCSNLSDLSPRIRGIIATLEHKITRLAHTPKSGSRRVQAQSEYLKARAALAQAIRKLSVPATDEQGAGS